MRARTPSPVDDAESLLISAMNGFFERLKQRKLVQWGIAYAAAAFALLQGTDIVAQRFGWPEIVERTLIIAACIGFFIVLVLAWYHGERGAQRVTATELLIISVVLALGGGFLWRFSPHRSAQGDSSALPNDHKTESASTIQEKSIAVLPFDNLSHDPENAYFSEGIQDEILTRLAKIAELKVISRTSTQKYKSTPENLRDIAHQLGVANVLEGSVQKANDQVRVNVQLINALNDQHLWADSYDRKLTDIFAVESEIARTVAGTLQARLTGSAEHVLASKPTENPEAHQLYLKGRYFWDRRTADNMIKALRYFQQAIDHDPSYALAYAGVSDCYSLLPLYSDRPSKEDVQRSIVAARQAIELDDSLAEAHTSLANALAGDLQFAAAEAEFKRAIALNPNYATVHHWFGVALQTVGRFEEGLAELRRAYDLDPLSLVINAYLASALSTAGRQADAMLQIQRAMDLDPNFGVTQEILGQILEDKGDLAGAADAYKKAVTANPQSLRTALLGCLYVRSGKTAEARKILADLTSRAKHEFVPSYSLALIHAMLGEKDEAIQLIEKAYDERSIQMSGNTGSLKIDPRLDSLRGDPRFQRLLAKFMGETS